MQAAAIITTAAAAHAMNAHTFFLFSLLPTPAAAHSMLRTQRIHGAAAQQSHERTLSLSLSHK
jgi:hypothetical protein